MKPLLRASRLSSISASARPLIHSACEALNTNIIDITVNSSFSSGGNGSNKIVPIMVWISPKSENFPVSA